MAKPFHRPGSPFWWIAVKNSEGNREQISTKTTSLTEAKAILESLRTKSREDKFFDKPKEKQEAPRKIFLDELFDDYISSSINLSESYFESSLKYSFAFFSKFFHGREIQDIETSDFLEYRKARKAGKLGSLKAGGIVRKPGDSRINNDIAGISKVFSWALTEKKYQAVLRGNPVVWNKAIKKTDGKQRGYLGESGKTVFLNNCFPVFRRDRGIGRERPTLEKRALPIDILRKIVIFLWVTGLRIEECLTLKKGQINFEIESIGLSKAETKGKKDRNVPFRKAEVSQILLAECKGKKDQDYVFQWKGKKVSYAAVRNAFERVCESGGLENIDIHSLRKTAAIDMYLEGYSLIEIKNILGHRRIETTMIYVDESIITEMQARKRREAQSTGLYEFAGKKENSATILQHYEKAV